MSEWAAKPALRRWPGEPRRVYAFRRILRALWRGQPTWCAVCYRRFWIGQMLGHSGKRVLRWKHRDGSCPLDLGHGPIVRQRPPGRVRMAMGPVRLREHADGSLTFERVPLS